MPDDPSKTRRKSIQTEWYPLSEILSDQHGQMKKIGDELGQKINTLISEGADKIEINWKNIPDRNHNPDETSGFFRIIATKKE